MNYTVKEYRTLIGRYAIDEAPNEFLRKLMVRATVDGVVVYELDHEGCLVTVYSNDEEI